MAWTVAALLSPTEQLSSREELDWKIGRKLVVIARMARLQHQRLSNLYGAPKSELRRQIQMVQRALSALVEHSAAVR
jgi:hypothetical protein